MFKFICLLLFSLGVLFTIMCSAEAGTVQKPATSIKFHPKQLASAASVMSPSAFQERVNQVNQKNRDDLAKQLTDALNQQRAAASAGSASDGTTAAAATTTANSSAPTAATSSSPTPTNYSGFQSPTSPAGNNNASGSSDSNKITIKY